MEITKLIGYKSKPQVRVAFIDPLLESGELLRTIPDKPSSTNQRYVIRGFDSVIFSREAVLEFCRVPRRKPEICEHFGQNLYQMRFIVNPLIEDGSLRACDESMQNNAWKRYVAAEYADEFIMVDRDKQIQEFCQEPRTSPQMAEFLGMRKPAHAT